MIIKIFAGPAEGKTTIATWLEIELKKLGIEVQNTDKVDDLNVLNSRLEVLGNSEEPLKVEIKTIEYKAESRPSYAKKFRP
jgi:adenylylsulfate kinase-like enzyme